MINQPPLQRYCFHIAYAGSHYRGWQYQPSIRSVQDTLQNALAKVLRLPSVTIIGCGRTDAGVHASQYAFHSDLPPIPDIALILYRLNKTLPNDIAVYDILPMSSNWHARFSAQWRSYDYLIHLSKQPFLETQSMPYYDRPTNLDAMRQAVALFPQYEDYAGLCRQPHLHNTTICRVSEAQLWQSPDGRHLRFHIRANRFLRGQIRILVRKLLEVAEGKLPLADLETVLETGERPSLLLPAPPQGLYLSGVGYHDVVLEARGSAMLGGEWVLV